MKLIVYSKGIRAGVLDMAAGEPFYGFTYDADYLASEHPLQLSLSLPLQQARFTGAESLPYFEGLLPEGDVRASIARQLGISEHSPAKLLRALGRDCAGSISVLEEDDPYQPPADDRYIELPGGLQQIVKNPYGEISKLRAEHRLSLAGGQEKIALYHDDREPMDRGWYVPVEGSPSTHILKPQVDNRYPNLVFNEYFCMTLAGSADIPSANVELPLGTGELLAVRRYDRQTVRRTSSEGFNVVERIAQEDFCQALGFSSERKYQQDGGPRIYDLANLLLRHSSNYLVDRRERARLLAFNFFIGNCDAHAKNYSVLQETDGSVRLAPAYDLVSTTVYDGNYGGQLSRSMGMSIGTHSNIDRVNANDMIALAEDLSWLHTSVAQVFSETAKALRSSFARVAQSNKDRATDGIDQLLERIDAGIEARIAQVGLCA